MSSPDPSGKDWSDNEIDFIVADYFAMLRAELAGASFVKAHHNAELQRLTGRTRGSVEFKHQNISAVLLRLGLPWIEGYRPMANFQSALIDGIERDLAADEKRIFLAEFYNGFSQNPARAELSEEAPLFVGAAPLITEQELSTPHFMVFQ